MTLQMAGRDGGWVRTGHMRMLSGQWGGAGGQCGPSEGEAALLGVAHAVQVGQAGVLDHGRGSAHQYQWLVLRGRQVVPDHLLIHKALAVVPRCGAGDCMSPSVAPGLTEDCPPARHPPLADAAPV